MRKLICSLGSQNAIMALNCVVHYELDYHSNIRELSDHNYQRLLEAKEERIKSLRITNKHFQQTASIPSTLNRTVHGIHWECYKKYALILSRRKSINDEVSPPCKTPKER